MNTSTKPSDAPADSARLSVSDIPIDPQLICPCREHRRFWLSATGGQIVCGECHPPAQPDFVAQWYDAGEREQPLIVKLSIERASKIDPHPALRTEGTEMEKTPYVKNSPTSRQAARRAHCSVTAGRRRVYEFVQSRGSDGATDEEIQQALGMKESTERPRRRELEQLGLIGKSGRKRLTSSGNPAAVWIVNGRGVASSVASTKEPAGAE